MILARLQLPLKRTWLLISVTIGCFLLLDLVMVTTFEDILVRVMVRWSLYGILGGALMWLLIRHSLRAMEETANSEERYRRLVELCPDPIIVHANGLIVFANPAAASLAGFPDVTYLKNRPIFDFIHPDWQAEVIECGRTLFEQQESTGMAELTVVRSDGELLRVESATMLTVFEDQQAVQVVLRDITERKRVEQALEFQATHDALTGLANRALLLDRLANAIERDSPSGLLLMDLDRFKEVNDTLGHHAGDTLLQQVGARLRGVLRDAESIARLGGDEFAAVVPLDDGWSPEELAEELLHLFETPFQVDGQPVVIGASIGIAQFPEHGTQPDTLLRRADVAMYVAKRNGEGFAMYESRHDQNSPDRLLMIGDLRRAVDQGELVLHFQPKIDLRTGGLEGVEALVRWQHPIRGLIPPDQFIAVAEQAGLIDALSQWVLRAALRQCRTWKRSGIEIPVAINLSPRNLHDQTLPDTIARLLEQHELPARLLGVEITESTLMADPARALEVLGRLRDMGIRVAIDDFGTGHSSLAYLKQLPVAELKIDRSFVRDILSDEGDRLIVRATVELAHSFGLRVVAEGVEDALTQRLLMDLGCDVGQGYHMSKPLRGTEVTQWLHEHLSNAQAA